MNVLLAIPARNQNKYIEAIVDAIGAMSVKPSVVLYMADRPTSHDTFEATKLIGNTGLVQYYPIRELPSYVGRPQMNYNSDMFLAGYVRNKAIEYMHVHKELDAVVFIDGDCIPEPDLIKSHMSVLSADGAVLSVGKRKEAEYGWDDQRMEKDSLCKIFHDTPTEITDEKLFVDSGVVWTCNFGMNRAAVQEIVKTNEELYGRPEVFSSDFLGTWGGEDGFLGLECFYRGIPVIALENGNNGIRHQYHSRDSKQYDHLSFMNYLEQQRERLLYLLDNYDLNDKHISYIPREELLINDY